MISVLRSSLLWLAALILMVATVFLAVDYGGVLTWSQLVAAIAVVVAGLLACSRLSLRLIPGDLRRHVLLVPLAGILVYGWFQTVPLSSALVSAISPGSYAAYTDWISPFTETAASFPVSLDAWASGHVIAFLGVILGLCWAGSLIFDTPGRVIALLTSVAVLACCFSAFGLWQLFAPDWLTVESSLASGLPAAARSGFGTYINADNAALLLNIGLAAGFGLMAWRMAGAGNFEIDDEGFEINELFSLISDRRAWIALITVLLCFAGLVATGSRGGWAAMFFGVVMTFGWLRRRLSLVRIPGYLAIIAVLGALLFAPLQISDSARKRLNLPDGDGLQSVLEDGTWQHWHDGWQAATSHFMGGSGLGTYAYAYLPHQSASPPKWYLHAQNFWLEWLTEQGLAAVLLGGLLIGLVAYELFRLGESLAPADQGLRAAGWFLFGVLLVSQAFDFGISVPANAFIVTMVFAAVVARSSVTMVQAAREAMLAEVGGDLDEGEPVVQEESTKGGKKKSKLLGGLVRFSRKWKGRSIAVAAASMIGLLLSVGSLKSKTTHDALSAQVDLFLSANANDPESLSTAADRLEEAIAARATPAHLMQLSTVRYRQARLTEAETMAEQSGAEELDVVAAYFKTTAARRRLAWHNPESFRRLDGIRQSTEPARDVPVDETGRQLYERALDLAGQVLERRPLSRQARPPQLILDFIHRDKDRTSAAISQLATFDSANVDSLLRLGTYAADGKQWELASELWASALKVDSRATERAIKLATEYPEVDVVSLLPPDDQHSFTIAAQMVLEVQEGLPSGLEIASEVQLGLLQ
ncbi:MAG: O-antigen ligase family protein, partial [Planctomycetota bacterium]